MRTMRRFSKKNRKYLGRRRRGYGYQQPRGGGYKGGRGAGIKRSGHKKINLYKYHYEEYIKSRKGFTSIKSIKEKIIEVNLGEIPRLVEKYPEIVDGNKIDLNKLGKVKVLGRGSLDKAYEILAYATTKSAKEKIESLGGRIETTV